MSSPPELKAGGVRRELKSFGLLSLLESLHKLDCDEACADEGVSGGFRDSGVCSAFEAGYEECAGAEVVEVVDAEGVGAGDEGACGGGEGG